jgi:hypothetical protein
MPSSRWKRFAFFDRHTLNLASEVLEDLIPIGGGITASSANTDDTRDNDNKRSSTRRSMNSLHDAAEASCNDTVSLVVTTASLPLDSKPAVVPNTNARESDNNALALNDMWSSLTACNPVDFPGATTREGSTGSAIVSSLERNIKLPSQSQATQDESHVVTSTNSVDGLVLVFVTSQDTDRIHCFDVTVRCSPPTTTLENDLEDLDGWRGYIAPLKGQKQSSTTKSMSRDPGGARISEERIIAEHMGGQENSSDNKKEGVIGIATTRATSGHRPVHMACISHNKLVVCVDPHLYLSW